MEKIFLKLLYIFRGVFSRQGINVAQMFLILELKLKLDKRRVKQTWRKEQVQDADGNKSLAVQLGSMILGLVVAAIIYLTNSPSPIIAMIIFHSYLLVMMALSLITDFSSVLLDTTDNQVILPRPVDSKTLFMARALHVCIYLLQSAIVLALFPVIVVFIKFGALTGLASLITVSLTVMLAVLLTYLLYLIILKVSSEEKVKEVVTGSQIFITVFFAVAYQLLPRIIDVEHLMDGFKIHWYSYLIPPVWMAYTLDAVHSLAFDLQHILMIVLAFAVPMFTFWLLLKYFAPYFAAKLAATAQASGATKGNTITTHTKSRSISDRLGALLCKTPLERAGFSITWRITGRDKSFRMQFYPVLGYIAVFIFIFVFNRGQNFREHWQKLPDTKAFLWLIYLPVFSISTSITLIPFNENYQAAWVYYSSPVKRPGEIIAGMMKALFAKYFIPTYIIMFGFSYLIWGAKIIDGFLFGLFNNLLCFLLISFILPRYLPFSAQPDVNQQSGRFIKTMLQMMIIALMVAIHYLLLKLPFWWISMVLLLPIIAGIYGLFWRMHRLAWSKINS